mmetsp:Transcript_23352/g.73560  ORF Transcript_23352/g.73560 Transcript_23352/m.73560 type:complete len:417 (+) Transcript_23352:404-1654(+)
MTCRSRRGCLPAGRGCAGHGLRRQGEADVELALGTAAACLLPRRRLALDRWLPSRWRAVGTWRRLQGRCRRGGDGQGRDRHVRVDRLPLAEEVLDALDLLLHCRGQRLVKALVRGLADAPHHLGEARRARPVLWISRQQPVDQAAELGTPRHGMLKGDEVLGVTDCHRGGVVLKGVVVERQRVEDTPKHPNVDALGDRVALPVVQLDVGHLGWPVEHRYRLVDLFLQLHARGPGQLLRRHALRAARAEVAQLPHAVVALQDVLHLQVTVLDGGPLGVQVLDGINDLRERLYDLARSELAVLAVHEVEKVPATTELHQEFHCAAATSGVMVDGVPEAPDDVRVRRQLLKYLCLELSRFEAAGYLHVLLTVDLLQCVGLTSPGIYDLHDLTEGTLGYKRNLVDGVRAPAIEVLKHVHG